MGNYADITSTIHQPRCRHAWRHDDGTAHASVALGESSLVFEDPAVAHATAAACAIAGGELDALAAGAGEGFAYGNEPSVTAVVLVFPRELAERLAALDDPERAGAPLAERVTTVLDVLADHAGQSVRRHGRQRTRELLGLEASDAG